MDREPAISDIRPELKQQNAEQLFERLVSYDWTEQEREKISGAYELVSRLHAEDFHRGKPYIYHLLRVANRIVSPNHLDYQNANLVIAALLHDSVEDHPREITRLYSPEPKPKPVRLLSLSAIDRQIIEQQEANECLRIRFGDDVADMIAMVTNPADLYDGLDGEAKYSAYQEKVERAITEFEGFLLKFSDWIDNAVGIIHSAGQSAERDIHFKRKYGPLAHIYEMRINQTDAQRLMSVAAIRYAMNKIETGKLRLAA